MILILHEHLQRFSGVCVCQDGGLDQTAVIGIAVGATLGALIILAIIVIILLLLYKKRSVELTFE